MLRRFKIDYAYTLAHTLLFKHCFYAVVLLVLVYLIDRCVGCFCGNRSEDGDREKTERKRTKKEKKNRKARFSA
jgi:hypothetical protein